MKLMNAKGTRDFGPEDKIIREEIVDKLKKIFRLYGYNPIETPIIERFEVLSAKYAGGAEILKECFKLNDQGKRELGLRYDLTVPFSRFVGMNPNIKMPFKRYQIGRVFRDGPIKLGRYREFWQCDVDVVGSKTMMAEAELLAIAERFFKELDFDIIIRLNNRKILSGLLDFAKVAQKDKDSVILCIDKLEKVGMNSVRKELKEKGIKTESIDKLEEFFNEMQKCKSNNEILSKVKEMLTSDSAKEGITEIEELVSFGNELKFQNVIFDISLARGLSYYTGTIFEVFLNSEKFKSAISGGGRYDNMISDFLGTKMPYPAVGISFGLEGIIDIIKMERENVEKSVVKFYIIPIGTKKESLKLAQELREKNINVDLDIVGRGISKNLDFADKNNIPYVIFAGENELKEGKVKLKDMNTGDEKFIKVSNLSCQLKKL